MKMVKDYKIDEKVIFHGFMSSEELDNYLIIVISQ